MHWTLWIFIVGSLVSTCVQAQVQRVAPGVPPQHYQQPPQQMHPHQAQYVSQDQLQQQQQQQHQQQQHPQQQHQPQQQQQFQHVPVQQPPQQVPMQQVPMQQHAQNPQVPVQQVHGSPHAHEQHPQQILNAANIAHETAHIAEHMEVPIDTSKMSQQELQFHYFKMHDSDNNNKLDGCELIKSLIHWHEQGNKEQGHANAAGKLFSDNELVNLIDPILTMDDSNTDGYIDYPEFVRAQQYAAASNRQ